MQRIMLESISFHYFLQKIYHFDFWLVLAKISPLFRRTGLKQTQEENNSEKKKKQKGTYPLFKLRKKIPLVRHFTRI